MIFVTIVLTKKCVNAITSSNTGIATLKRKFLTNSALTASRFGEIQNDDENVNKTSKLKMILI